MANVYVDSLLRSGTKENCRLEIYRPMGNTRELRCGSYKGIVYTIV